MRRRIFAVLLFFCLAASLLPASAVAVGSDTGKVSVTIGNETTYYDTIDDAWAAAAAVDSGSDEDGAATASDTGDATVTLLADVTTDSQLKLAEGNRAIILTSAQKAEGKYYAFTANGDPAILMDNSNTLTIKKINISSTQSDVIKLYRNSKLTIEDGAVIIPGKIENICRNVFAASSESTVTITGGTLNGKMQMYSESTATISGGTFASMDIDGDSTVNISGGTFSGMINLSSSNPTSLIESKQTNTLNR